MKEVRIDKYEYRIGGILPYYKREINEITVDGKTYTNIELTDMEYDIDESFLNKDTNNEWRCWENNLLEPYGIVLKEWYNTRFSNLHIEKLMYCAINFNDIPKNKIKHIHYGKFDSDNDSCAIAARKFISQGIFNVCVAKYGFNNSINIGFSIKYFLTIPFKQHNEIAQDCIERYYKDILPKAYFERELTEKEIFYIAMQLFKYKIKIKNKGVCELVYY